MEAEGGTCMEVFFLLAGVVAGGFAALYAFRLSSSRADRVRRVDDKAGSTLDEYRFQGANHAALPVRNRDFDKPR